MHRSPLTSAAHHRLAAFVLLAGSVREQPLMKCAGRSVLGLPVRPRQNLLEAWDAALTEIREITEHRLPLLISTNAATDDLRQLAAGVGAELALDAEAYRGTGGAIADIAKRFDDDSVLLIANGSNLPPASLRFAVDVLTQAKAGVSILAGKKDVPLGLMWVTCGALRHLPAKGFVDFKEQALPTITARHAVRVAHMPLDIPAVIRDLPSYLAAVRRCIGGEAAMDAFEGWQPGFSLKEEGALVDASAKLHDTVVLRGATVGAGAVVVRSVVAGGGRVRPGATVIDELVGPTLSV